MRISAVLSASPLAACADAARQPGPARSTITGLAVAILLASATGAGAQVPRNGPEWGGKDHQPTEAETLKLENQAGVQAPKDQREEDKRTVQQLDRQLLREEGLNPAPSSAPPTQR